MSKLVNYLVPALAGTGVMMGGAYLVTNAAVPDISVAPRTEVSSITPPAVETAAAEPVVVAEPTLAAEPVAIADAAPVAAPAAQAPDTQDTQIVLAQATLDEVQAPPTAGPVVLALGRPATAEEIAAWDIDIRPDGAGLPEGSGDVWMGEELYIDNCAVCHGDFGEAIGRWPVLAGGQGSLTDDRPVKTIGSYWPYLSTVFDYVNRAMPFGNAQSLSDDEVYAITAYLLYLNDLVDDDFVLDRESFVAFEMPNQNAFYMDDRAETEYAALSVEPCMSDCMETVEITARAAIVDVTPEDEAARTARAEAAKDSDSVEAEVAIVAEVETITNAETTAPLVAPATGPDPELVAAGERVFKQCSSCHQVGDGARNRTGPALNGVVGHPIGAIEGFRYSNILQQKNAEGAVWDEEALAGFLTAPRDWAPGTKMSFRGLRAPEDVDAVIAYIGTFDE